MTLDDLSAKLASRFDIVQSNGHSREAGGYVAIDYFAFNAAGAVLGLCAALEESTRGKSGTAYMWREPRICADDSFFRREGEALVNVPVWKASVRVVISDDPAKGVAA